MKKQLCEIEFKDSKINEFYKSIWKNNHLEFDVIKKGRGCEFCLSDDSISKTLIKNFEIENEKEFNVKLEQAITGDGDEENKILNLRSSSLCSLLFFYNVTPNNPLDLCLNGDNCQFKFSIFEFKNKVISKASNIDVVLLGHRLSDGKKVILFLESKFGEYYFDVTNLGSTYEVPFSYYKNYGQLYEKVVSELGYGSTFEKKQKNDKSHVFEIHTGKNRSYIGGIKQMISHYIGVGHFAQGKYANNCINTRIASISEFLKTEYVENQILNQLLIDSEIYLGEIIFDGAFGNLPIENEMTYLSDYEEKHIKLAKILENYNENKSIHIVSNLLHYSDYKNWNHNIEGKVQKYYFGN